MYLNTAKEACASCDGLFIPYCRIYCPCAEQLNLVSGPCRSPLSLDKQVASCDSAGKVRTSNVAHHCLELRLTDDPVESIGHLTFGLDLEVGML